MKRIELPVVDLESYGLRPKFPEVIDSSMLKCFIDCRRMFYYRHVLGLRRKSAEPEATVDLDWGSKWHGLQEVYEKTGDPVQALTTLDPWPAGLHPATDPAARSKERMAEVFFGYIEKYKEVDKIKHETVRFEQYFDVFNEEFGIRWAGRIDKVVKRNNKLVVWDHKTTRRMGPRYFDQHEFSFQLPGYVWAIQQITGEPVNKILIDVLYTIKRSHDYFRHTFRYTEPRIDEWRRNVMMILEDMYYLRDNYLYSPEAWGLNWNECSRYGTCQFADVDFLTPTEDNLRLKVLEQEYTEDRWDPRIRV